MKWSLRYLYSPAQAPLACLLGFPLSGPNLNCQPFATQASTLFRSYGLSVPPRVYTPAFSPIPPNVSLHRNICLDPGEGLSLSLHASSSSALLAHMLESSYPGSVHIYTDGSRSSEGSVSAGVYIPSLSLATGWLLSPSYTVMGAELFAISKALEITLSREEFQSKPVVIITDSRSSLNLIRNTYRPAYTSMIFKIQLLLLQKGLNSVSLCWVKSHSGVRGNEIADRVANLAHGADKSSRSTLCFRESLCQLKKSFLIQWKEHWHREVASTNTGRFRLSLEDSINYTDYSGLSRKIQCAVACLRLGHAGVGAYRTGFGMAQDPICPTCNQEDTISHFLLTCTRITVPRIAFAAALADI